MSTLCKRPRSPYFYCCYNSADGRRLKKSTKQTVRTKALEVCLALERAEQMAVKGTLTETRARELIGEVLERTTGEDVPFYTAESWLKDWLRGKQVSKSENTHVKYNHTVDSFLEHLGARAKLNIAAITSKDISNFRDNQITSGKHPNTVRYLIKQLRIPFNAAKRQGVITHNPAEAVELPIVNTNEDGKEGSRDIFTPEQINALLNASIAKKQNGQLLFEAGEDWKGLILFAYHTGARLQDAANITWNAIDLPGKKVTYRAQKTGRLTYVPLHKELEAHLLELPATDNAKTFVFSKLAGKNTGGRSGLSSTFLKIMEQAKIQGEEVRKKIKGSKGRTVRSLTFHSLRHTFNSAMANAGISQEVRMQLTGHTSADMNTGYTHLKMEPLRNAIDTLPSVLKP